MRLPLLLLFSVSMTVTSKNHKQKEDYCGGQWDGSNLPKACMHFAVSLYKLVSSNTEIPPPNFFLSPLSIYTTLAVLGLGARSSTQQQILDAMCLNATQADKILKDDFKNFLEKLRAKQGEVEFRFSNWLFLDKSFSPDTKYEQELVNYYNTYIYIVDFKDPSKAERSINEQLSGHLDGKIEDLVSNVKTWSLMFLLDYAKFSAKWEKPFTYQGTSRGLFKVNKKKTVEVKMMHQVGQFKTLKDRVRDCVVVQVPYTDQLVLLLIVPNNGHLDELENKLSVRLIELYLSKAQTSLLDLYIPIVFVQQEVNVQSALMKMGILQVFDESADLSGISKRPKLKVAEIDHKTVINIVENQTDSVEGAIIEVFTVPSAFEFKIDRPFLALVYNKPLNSILLLGRVMDPSDD